MIYSTIPARNDLPFYSFQIPLSKILFTLQFKYNIRMERWILDINNASGNQILSGIPLLINRNLTTQYPTLLTPPGILFVTDDTGLAQQPTLYSFGTTHTLRYGEES